MDNTNIQNENNITLTKLIYTGDFDLVKGTIIQPLPTSHNQPQLINVKIIYCPNNEFTNELTNIHLQELL